MAKLTDSYFERLNVSNAIFGKTKYVARLKPLARVSSYAYEKGKGYEFEKVCRGYAIGEYQKRGVTFDDEDIEWVVAEVHWKILRLV